MKKFTLFLATIFFVLSSYSQTGTIKGFVYDKESGLVKFRNCCWFTNLDHGRRHKPLPLMTLEDNKKFSITCPKHCKL